jgi:hypothetical protein
MGCEDLIWIQWGQERIWWWVPVNTTVESVVAIRSVDFHVQHCDSDGICYVSLTCKIYGTLYFRATDGHHAEGDKPGVQFT